MPAPKNDARRPTAAEVLQRYNEESLPDFCEPLADVNQVGTFGNRPLHLASYRGNMDDIAALVEGAGLECGGFVWERRRRIPNWVHDGSHRRCHAPTVLSVTPSNGATGMGLNAAVVLTFSKASNRGTVNSSNFALLGTEAGWNLRSGIFLFAAGLAARAVQRWL